MEQARTGASDRDRFGAVLKRNLGGILELPPAQVDLLFTHYELLTRWNQALNLTSIRTLEDAVVRHYCESLFLGLHMPREPVSVLDFGSGGGFPGIPLAILRPDCRITLAESHRRKAVFLREATRNWANVRVLAARTEEIGEPFDWVVSRAVRWEDVVKVAVRIGRRIALLLGDDDAQRAARTDGVRWSDPVRLPWGKRRVLLLGVPRGT